MSSPRPAPSGGTTGRWYFVVTIISGGLLSAVPFFHAASHLDRPQLRVTGGALTVGGLVGFGLMGLAPTDRSGDPTGWLSDLATVVLVGVIVVATVLLVRVRREVYPPLFDTVAPTSNAAAVTRMEQARQRRQEARRLAASDPMMARELGIGRGVAHQRGYDDGGLLDVNVATSDEMCVAFGLPREVGDAVVSARTSLGRFESVDDAIHFGQVDERDTAVMRERAIVISDR